MEFVDTHTHLSDGAFAGEQEAVVQRALDAGVVQMLQADTCSQEREAMYKLCSAHEGVLYPMLGLYPGNVDENWRDELDAMLPYRSRGPVAIGEIGLDYHYGADTAALQKEAFKAQLELARDWGLPVNIHLREATEDFFSVMEECRGMHLRGNLHAFSGSAEVFERVQRYGEWYVGIGGVLTFKKARIATDILRIPLERILLETDAPYLAPTPLRGKRNESANIPRIAAFLAALKGIDLQTVASVTTANARKLFAI
ncbi:MAG: TatD family hydrolase [Bacteroidales bacterium]|nr:TatD family hydrolase [Bacteroidales bacterium]